MDIKVNVAYDRTLAALSHVKEAADVLAEVIINQGLHSPSFEVKVTRNSEYGNTDSERAKWEEAFAKPNELTKEMAKPAEGKSIPDKERDVRAEIKSICDDVRAAVPEVASIHDMADKLRGRNQELIRELNEMEEKAKGWETKAKNWETAARKLGTESDNWRDTAALASCNADYYMDIVDRIANELGPDAYTADDGVRGDSPIRDKVYVLARNAIYREGLLQHAIKHIGAKLLPFADVLNDAGELDLNRLEQGITSVLSSYADLLASALNVGKLRDDLDSMTKIAAKNNDQLQAYVEVNKNLSEQLDQMRTERDHARQLIRDTQQTNSELRQNLRTQQGYRDTAIRERNEANAELSETSQALKIVVKERDDAREAVKYAQNLATRETDTRAEYARKLETNSKNLNKMDAELQEVVKERDNVSDNLNFTIKRLDQTGLELVELKQNYQELTAAYHGVNLAHNDLQRRVANAKNQLDLEGQLNETPKTGEKPFYHGLR